MTPDQLKTVLSAHKQWLDGDHAGKRADLTGADLHCAYLRGAYLHGADLTGANLRYAYLTGANLRGADLHCAYLRGAILTGADLRGAILTGANLRYADLTGANLRGAYLHGADLTGANLRGADLTGADLRGAILTGADLRGADLRDGIKAKRLVGLATRGIDSYVFHCIETDSDSDRFYYIAGCRSFTRAEFERHIESEYPGTEKASKTRACLDYLESLA